MWALVLGIPFGIVIGVMGFAGLSTQIAPIILVLAAVFILFLNWPWGRRQAPHSTLAAALILLCSFLLGVALGTLAKQRFMPLQLDSGQSYFLTGTVTGVPQWGQFSRRYQIEASCLGSSAERCDVFENSLPFWPVRVELTLSRAQPDLVPGQELQIQVRARASRSQSSPAEFNVARWLLVSHTVARLALVKGSKVQVLGQSLWSVDRLRAGLNRYLAEQPETTTMAGLAAYPVILALVTGDRSLMSDRHWQVFNRTGTTHLVAISGLHIGLVATFTLFVMLPLLRRWRWFTNRYAASQGAVIIAWWVALFYTAMAGFALPTQRAMIMLTVFVVLKLLGRARQLWFGLAVAFCLVLVWDPVACLSMGFWLSFVAVYLILWLIGGEVERSSAVSQWLTVQLGLFVGLAPVLLWVVHSVSLVSVLTNLIAIPLIGFVVVPLSLLWASLWGVLGEQADFLLHLAALVHDGLLWFLQHCADWRYSVWTVGERSYGSMVLAMIGVLWLVSAGVPGRLWGILLMLPLLMPQTQGLGAYVMGAGSGRLVFQQEHTVLAISRSHWPQPIAGWQRDLLQMWGIGVPPGAIPLNHTRALWLAKQGTVSEFDLSSNWLGARQLERVHYSDLCRQGSWGAGTIHLQQWQDKRFPAHCATEIQWAGQRWLYWPLEGSRAQKRLLQMLAQERFQVIVLDVGKGKQVEPSILDLLAPEEGRLISIKPVPQALQQAIELRGVKLHTVADDGYVFLPLEEAQARLLAESTENGTK